MPGLVEVLIISIIMGLFNILCTILGFVLLSEIRLMYLNQRLRRILEKPQANNKQRLEKIYILNFLKILKLIMGEKMKKLEILRKRKISKQVEIKRKRVLVMEVNLLINQISMKL